jgi:hypothetical protein
MISNKCPSLFKCHKIRGVLDRDGTVEQMVNESMPFAAFVLVPGPSVPAKRLRWSPFPAWRTCGSRCVHTFKSR